MESPRGEHHAREQPLVAVVDDDESVRESLPDLLWELGFAAHVFSSAQEFLMSDGSSGGCAASSADATRMPRPRIGSVMAMTSAASVTGVAPCLRSPLVPSLRG